MRQDAKLDSLPDSRKYVTILLDEMKVKEDLVYDKHSGEIIGFTNLGIINEQLLQAEREMGIDYVHPPIAKQILAIMIRGLFLISIHTSTFSDL